MLFKIAKHMKQPNATWLGALFMWTTRSHLVLEKKQKEHKNNIYFLETKTKFNVWRVTLWLLLLYSTFKRVSFPLRFFISIYLSIYISLYHSSSSSSNLTNFNLIFCGFCSIFLLGWSFPLLISSELATPQFFCLFEI
jgi:hypothetical protein